MNSESHTSLKICNSCRRSLPTYFFGLRKYSKDGYNPSCKDCRNYRRRRSYRNAEESFEEIWPLNEHNRNFLFRLPEFTRLELIGVRLSTLNAASIVVEKKAEGEFSIMVTPTDASQYSIKCNGSKIDFINGVLPLLAQLGIRLFYLTEAHSLSNWGLSHAR